MPSPCAPTYVGKGARLTAFLLLQVRLRLPCALSGRQIRADWLSARRFILCLVPQRGQVMASLNEHLPGPNAGAAAASGRGGVAVRPLGQPALDGGEYLFMMEVLESKVRLAGTRAGSGMLGMIQDGVGKDQAGYSGCDVAEARQGKAKLGGACSVQWSFTPPHIQ